MSKEQTRDQKRMPAIKCRYPPCVNRALPEKESPNLFCAHHQHLFADQSFKMWMALQLERTAKDAPKIFLP